MKINLILIATLIVASSCSSWNKTKKGAVIGTAGGAATGAVIGKAAGNTALGAIIGAAVGGVTGVIIGRNMDKQAEELKSKIPDAKIERVGEGIEIEFNSQILFGFDQISLSTAASDNLNKLVSVLNKYPDTNIEIQGHTDNQGTSKYNRSLSTRRAQSVANYISQSNISSSRLSIKGFGESAPKYTNENASGQAQNRRVEFLVFANKKMKDEATKQAGSK